MPVHVRQIKIEKNQIGPMFAGEIKTGAAFAGTDQLDRGPPFENVFDQFQVGKVVLDIEDFLCAVGGGLIGRHDYFSQLWALEGIFG